MIDRAAIIEALARADRIIGWMAKHIGKMCPPDGGISDLNEHWLFMERKESVLAAVPPAQTDRAANHTPVDHLRAVLEMQASPTIDRGDSHGARGQKGWIVWESSLALVAAALTTIPPAPPSSDAIYTGATTDIDEEHTRPETWKDRAQNEAARFIYVKRRAEEAETQLAAANNKIAEEALRAALKFTDGNVPMRSEWSRKVHRLLTDAIAALERK